MTLELAAALVVLALIDSTSFGTLLIPVWLLLVPGRVHAGRVLLFLATVALFYFALGVGLLSGATALVDAARAVAGSPATPRVQLAIGSALLVLGLWMEPLTKAGKARRATTRPAREPGRMSRWRTQATDGSVSAVAVMSLALVAAAAEAATMVPYLGAIALLTTSSLTPAESIPVLATYCLVMVLPALLLLATRIAIHDRMTRLLSRVERWISRSARELSATLVLLLGLWFVGQAATSLIN